MQILTKCVERGYIRPRVTWGLEERSRIGVVGKSIRRDIVTTGVTEVTLESHDRKGIG